MTNPKDENKNGEVKGDRDKEEFIALDGGEFIENSSGNLVNKDDIVPPDNTEKGNGSAKGGK